MASDVIAMEHLDYRTDTRSGGLVVNEHTSWAIMSTAGAISRIHVDTGGLNTVSMPLLGEKYWAVGEAFKQPGNEEVQRDSASRYKAFHSGHVDVRYRWEAVSLNPGTALCVNRLIYTMPTDLTGLSV